jgi:hypothetical protein
VLGKKVKLLKYMKLEKKQWIMLIVGVVVLYLVYRFFFKKQAESNYNLDRKYCPCGRELKN